MVMLSYIIYQNWRFTSNPKIDNNLEHACYNLTILYIGTPLLLN